MDFLNNYFNSNISGVWIHGDGGLGKTTLASDVASRLTTENGVKSIFIDLKQTESVMDMTLRILEELGRNVHTGMDDFETCRSLAVAAIKDIDKDACLVFDNMEGIYEKDKLRTEELLQMISNNRNEKVWIIVTSRLALSEGEDLTVDTSDEFGKIQLKELTRNYAKKLLKELCSPVKLSEEELAAVAKACGNSPLAIGLIAERIKHDKIDLLLKMPGAALVGHEQVLECIQYSFDRLEEEMKSAVLMLSVYGTSSFNRNDAMDILSVDLSRAIDILMQLNYKNIISEAKTKRKIQIRQRFHFHPLIYEFLNKISNDERHKLMITTATERFCVRLLKKVDRYKDLEDDISPALSFVTNDAYKFRVLFRYMSEPGNAIGVSLTPTQCRFLCDVPLINLPIEDRKNELQIIERTTHSNRNTVAGIYCQIQRISLYLDDKNYVDAYNEMMLIRAEVEKTDSDMVKTEYFFIMGKILKGQKRFEDAKHYLDKAMKSNERNPDNIKFENKANILNSFGNIAFTQSDYQKAYEFHKGAIDTLREERKLRRHKDLSNYIFNLGTVAKENADHVKENRDEYILNMEEALRRFNESMEIDVEMGLDKHPNYAEKLMQRATLYVNLKKFEKAKTDYYHALSIRENMYGKVHEKTGIVKYKLGVLHYKMKRSEEFKRDSRQLLRKALEDFAAVEILIKKGMSFDCNLKEDFLTYYERIAKETYNVNVIKEVTNFCLRYRACRDLYSPTTASELESSSCSDESSDSETLKSDEGIEDPDGGFDRPFEVQKSRKRKLSTD